MPIIISGQLFLLGATILFVLLSTIIPYFVLAAYMFASVGFTSLGSSIGVAQLIQIFGGGLGVTMSELLLALQESLSSEIIYRNIYICFSFVIIIAVLIYGLYYRRARLKQPNLTSSLLE